METAFVLINCDLRSEKEIIEELKHIESIKEIKGTFGAYDIVTKIENPENNKVREVITQNIRKLPHVRSTLSLMSIQGQG